MRKLIAIIAALLITAFQLVHASNETSVPTQVGNAFSKKFGVERTAKWERINDVYVCRFTDGNQNFELYYSENGDLLAYGRYISEQWLPQLISDAIASRFSGYTITQTMEFNSKTTGSTSYYIHLENDEKKLFVRAFGDGTIEVLTRTKK